MNGKDDLTEFQPSRARLLALLATLALVLVEAGFTMWWLNRPRPPATEIVYATNPIGAAEMEGKKLPEYAELRGMAKRPLTDAEVVRTSELTKHPNAWIRLEARVRLATVRDGLRRGDAVSAVASGLRDESELMRADTMIHLSGMNARECEAELRGFLNSPIEEERGAARRAIRGMGLPAE